MPGSDKRMATVAVYPGTFDPVTYGHLNLICRGAKLFSKLIVGVAAGGVKAALFSLEERVAMIQHAVKDIDNVEVEGFHGLTVDFVKDKGASILLRGIRTVTDFEYEYQIALTNRAMTKNIETMFVIPGEEFSFISSSIIKDIVSAGGDAGQFVPQEVNEKLKERLAPRK
jgi:pantetheine-phosphate adenylyltransferase